MITINSACLLREFSSVDDASPDRNEIVYPSRQFTKVSARSLAKIYPPRSDKLIR